MPEDRSLDDFAEADDASGEAPTDGSVGADGDTTESGPDDSDEVEPATATSTWHGDGAACAECGQRVERRWRDGDDFVCADCASW
ncbi:MULTISPECIES: DUF7573 domain-containing protein [Halorubrum]|uniref:DUF7573 domain-containing protein n=1 Tax=Halorubrum sodomense TaxID=35743 RepID=A0A1I6FKW4_HALSD|nr:MULTISPECIES: zinc ribbon domain-containing protein [Halorubrum]TKX56190.1 hypothetical protein EXE42_01115 [Halorubrum sp. SP3]TKX68038.1 hypothetical protein EXE45_12765 [Halorubrum sp. SP9]SFR30596.1 hypothetical protein SAMN04487937_0422 [Halorubrum sodomense]